MEKIRSTLHAPIIYDRLHSPNACDQELGLPAFSTETQGSVCEASAD